MDTKQLELALREASYHLQRAVKMLELLAIAERDRIEALTAKSQEYGKPQDLSDII